MKIRFDVCNTAHQLYTKQIPQNTTCLYCRSDIGSSGWFLFAQSALHNYKTFNKRYATLDSAFKNLKELNTRFFRRWNYSFNKNYPN